MRDGNIGMTELWMPRSIAVLGSEIGRAALAGWLAGLVYHAWFVSDGAIMPRWSHFLLIVPGSMMCAVLIGVAVGLPVIGLAKRLEGRGLAAVKILGICLAAMLAFEAANIAHRFLGNLIIAPRGEGSVFSVTGLSALLGL